jgi:tetratricopeptide (TPR) repeat protein
MRVLIGILGLVVACSQSVVSQSPGPIISSLEPKAGVTTPGTRVTIRGEGLSKNILVYFDGLETRDVKLIDANTLEVATPFLRPGLYRIWLKSGETAVGSDLFFTAMPSPVDTDFDNAEMLVHQGHYADAVTILASVSKINPDPQVRAFAHYQAGQIYLAQGDLWRWGGEAAAIFDPAAGAAVQTSWRYRLSADQSDYFLPTSNDPDHDSTAADWTVNYDVTDNPEPRFYRALVNSRYGNLQSVKADIDFILQQQPDNPSYRALAAYVQALKGDPTTLKSLSGATISDTRALSLLGQAAFLSGDSTNARYWWAQESKAGTLPATLDYMAGKKHLARGQQRVATALLTECTVVAPASEEARKSSELLLTLP